MSTTTPIWETLDEISLTPESLIPCGTRILVKRLERAEKTGGLYIPETAKQPQYIAKVISVGPEADFIPGEYIVIGRWNASSFRLLERPDAPLVSDRYGDYSILDVDDVWCRVKMDG